MTAGSRDAPIETGVQTVADDPFSAAFQLSRTPMLFTDPRRSDNPIVLANDAFLDLTGYSRADVLGRNCRFLQGPDSDPSAIWRLREAIRREQAVDVDLLNYRKDYTPFWNRLEVRPIHDGQGRLSHFFASMIDVTPEHVRIIGLERDRKALKTVVERRTDDLIHAENQLGFALRAGDLGTWWYELDYDLLIVDETFSSLLDQPHSVEISAQQFAEMLGDDLAAAWRRAIVDALRTNQLDFDIEIVTATGRRRTLNLRGQSFRRSNSTPILIGGVARDVTDRNGARKLRDLMNLELGHRIKNLLAIAQSVAISSIRHADSLRDAADIVQQRLAAMDAANRMFVEEQVETTKLSGVIQTTLAPFGIDDLSRFVIEGGDELIDAAAALRLALILHELATNAVKHGALSDTNGRVHIRWGTHSNISPTTVELCWEEKGGPPVTTPARSGFGSRLIAKVLDGALGTCAVEYCSSGLICTMTFPVSAQEPFTEREAP